MRDEHPLAGQTALITGGAKRIGAAMVLSLARAGVNVVVHYNESRAEAEAIASEAQMMGVHAWPIGSDLSRPDAGALLFEHAREVAGPIDILINSASIFLENTLSDFTDDDLAINMQLHAMIPLALARAMYAQGREGVVVNMLDARLNDYDRNHVAYHLSKRTLDALTRMMAVDFAPKIRVNAIAPGLILPPAGKDESYLASLAHTNPLNRYGGCDDITNALQYLLTSRFVTGQTIYVDGGRHLRGNFYG